MNKENLSSLFFVSLPTEFLYLDYSAVLNNTHSRKNGCYSHCGTVQSTAHFTLRSKSMYCVSHTSIGHYTHKVYTTPMYCILHPILYATLGIVCNTQYCRLDCTKPLYYIIEHIRVQFPAPSTALTMTLLSIYKHSPTINHFGRAIFISMKTSMTQKAFNSLIKKNILTVDHSSSYN